MIGVVINLSLTPFQYICFFRNFSILEKMSHLHLEKSKGENKGTTLE
jgi:hypothetical protein